MLDAIGYVFLWIGNLIVSIITSIRSVLAWFTPVIDFFGSAFSFLPSWVTALLMVCIAVSLAIFIIHLGGD